MSWIIEGARKVIEREFKIDPPKVVANAIAEYRGLNDWLTHFLTECCEVGKEYREKSGCLYQEYREYCVSNGEWTRSTTDFYAALDQAGYAKVKRQSGMYIHGLKLKPGPGIGSLSWEN